MLTSEQLTAIDGLIAQLGLPADGSGMRKAQEKVGASDAPYAYRLMSRDQAMLLLKLLRFYAGHQFTREDMDA